MSQIYLLGATGYTGSRTLGALADERADNVVLVGRNPERMRERARASALECEVVAADVSVPGALDDLVRSDDVVISTVGPFQRLGREVARSAAKAGAIYLDSTGEPPFIEWMFRTLGPVATENGAVMIPAFGYDFVPGHIAAAAALDSAGPAAVAVEIGYFLAPGLPGTPGRDRIPTLRQLVDLTTPGTRASLTGVVAEPSFAFRKAPGDSYGLRTAASGERLLRFVIDGTERTAMTIGGSEHFGLPDVYGNLERVDVGLGWFGAATPAIQRITAVGGAALRSRAAVSATKWLAEHLPWQGTMPSLPGRTLVAANAIDADGTTSATAVVEGPEPYEFTARLLAVAATSLTARPPEVSGVHGPLAAFGSAVLRGFTERAGLRQLTPPIRAAENSKGSPR
ncbi:saccharopine dehydrogenase NADP-binding domain-containing protein [Nocardia sp. NPDC050406]|uniref:saccharopine dehydrogenase NADP-binding domain-containing protein n=1 Tax=Nocardia sp. NPDC050406 TaxID=3364318 RepID=UPI00378816EB